jgi:hypothetical protein
VRSAGIGLLHTFIRQFAAVVCATLVPVVLTTFVTIPMNLGGFPGKERTIEAPIARHLT